VLICEAERRNGMLSYEHGEEVAEYTPKLVKEEFGAKKE
jgi:hypothetical protein